MTRTFVTGSSGFTGGHLVHHLAERGDAVTGFSLGAGDIRDRAAIRAALAAAAPEVIVHLAGVLRATDPQQLYAINVGGTVALLDAVVELGLQPVVVVVSSSAVYGPSRDIEPIAEHIEPRPRTHYGASKLAQEIAALRYVDAQGLHVVRVRTFNLLGPGLSAQLACGAFAERVARAERAEPPGTLRTGNLEALRDFTDVRDAVGAYALLASHGRAGEIYNVCSQRAVSIRRCAELLVQRAKRPVAMETDSALVQDNDVDVQIGDRTRITQLTGWQPTISLERSLEDMLDDTRWRLDHEGDRTSGR